MGRGGGAGRGQGDAAAGQMTVIVGLGERVAWWMTVI